MSLTITTASINEGRERPTEGRVRGYSCQQSSSSTSWLTFASSLTPAQLQLGLASRFSTDDRDLAIPLP
jgi:hypothetical protein